MMQFPISNLTNARIQGNLHRSGISLVSAQTEAAMASGLADHVKVKDWVGFANDYEVTVYERVPQSPTGFHRCGGGYWKQIKDLADRYNVPVVGPGEKR